jgi:malonyl CoA-acyl carrier protein transacylase/aryl carrier-like protein
VLDALGIDEASSRVAETRVAQPANLALQVALTRLLAHWGIVPGAVVGHSIGEVAAAWSCGALSLPDAVTVALRRSQYQQTLAATGGGMLAVAMTVEGASNLLRDYPGVAIAAINAPRSLTLSGALSDLATIACELDRFEVFQRLLQVEIAYHSPAMEAICEPLLASLAAINPRAPRLPWYSTVHGELQTLPCDAQYWWKNVREPVRFQATVERMAEDGFQEFLEVGPHPVLQSSLREILSRHAGTWIASTLHRKQPDSHCLLATAGALHVRGYVLNWPSIIAAGGAVRLPSYPWQRRHYWKESRRSLEDKRGRAGATWLWETLSTPFPAWQVDVNVNFFPWLNDHIVGGRVVFPGAAYVAAALALKHEVYGDAPCGIEELAFREMLVIEASHPRRLVSALDREAGTFRIYSHSGEEDDGAWRLHAEGRFRPGSLPPEVAIDLDALRQRCSRILDPDDYYLSLAKLGLVYGPAFRRIAGLRAGPGEVLLELVGAEERDVDPLPPAVLDALFQGLFAALQATGGQQRGMVPVAIASLRMLAPLSGRLLARLVLRNRHADEAEADMFLLNDQGRVLATATGVRCRAVTRPRQLLNPDWFHELAWQARAPSPLLSQSSRGWLLLGRGELPTTLAERLGRREQTCLSRPLPTDDDLVLVRDALYAGCQALLRILPQGASPLLLVFLDDEMGSAPDFDTAWRHSLLALALAQAIGHVIDEGGPTPVLCFITRMTQSVTVDAVTRNPGGAASWGLARVIASEIPGLLCRMVDLEEDPADVEAEFLQRHLAGEDIADEVAFRQGVAYQLQLIKSAATWGNIPPALADYPRHTPLVLDGWQPGNDHPFWREVNAPKPGLDQVLVEVDSWLLAPEAPVPPAAVAALEWHGRVRMPSNATGGMRDGQHVWGLQSAARSMPMATCMAVDRSAMWPVDKVEGFPDAVLPLLQAWHGLTVLGRLKKGETILLHNVADAMSLAWAEVACRLGARLLVGIPDAAARSVWKDRLDREDVLDASRLDYCEQLQTRCAGRLDVVVILGKAGEPALASPLTAPSVISAGGRLLIIDDVLPEGMSGKLLSAGVQLLPWKLAHFTGSSATMGEAVEWLRRELAAGWQPQFALPRLQLAESTSEAVSELAATLADARNGGLARLDLNTAEVIQALPADRAYCGLRRQASYLITGGTSGFGLALAEWLAGQGIAHLVLVSRRGHVESADQHRLDRLRNMSRVTLAAVDVTDADAVSALFAQLALDELPLRGVFHCAMVLSDAWLRDMDAAALDRVLRPKVAGAMNLHRETRGLELDCFVLFSSVSAIVGNAGQAAYAAANACLDGIAHWRRGLGLSALSVNWGVIGDVGVAARDEGLLDHLRQSGMGSLDSTEAFAALGALLLNGIAQAGVFNMDWARWREFALLWPARFHGFVTADIPNGGSVLDVLRRDMALLEPDAQLDFLTAHLRRQLARILCEKEDQVSVTQEISRFGLDSLLTLEWVIAINQEWGLNVSAVELLKASSLAQLAGKLLPRVIQ